MPIAPQTRQALLTLARETIWCAVRGQGSPNLDPDMLPGDLQGDGASFVTLTKHGQLRGCIGSLEAHRPLAEDIRENAVAAALQDPRFSPVSEEELGDLHIEVSVLSPPQKLEYDSVDDLVAKLRPGIDGVVIERGWNRATFLPQVWEKLPDPHQFLQHLCMKAYLRADEYREGDLNIYTYQVEEFEE